MPSTHKKVIVRKMDRDTINGHVAPANFIVAGKLEMLNTAGNLVAIDLHEIKVVYFVRDFAEGAPVRKTFATRPRTEGLWVRLRFKDNEVIEGMMPNDLAQVGVEGFLVNPPDVRANTQRMFIPRTALSALTVLGVVGISKARRRKHVAPELQVPMFEQ